MWCVCFQYFLKLWRNNLWHCWITRNWNINIGNHYLQSSGPHLHNIFSTKFVFSIFDRILNIEFFCWFFSVWMVRNILAEQIFGKGWVILTNVVSFLRMKYTDLILSVLVRISWKWPSYKSICFKYQGRGTPYYSFFFQQRLLIWFITSNWYDSELAILGGERV